jgi:hypothetical protein
MSKNNFFKSFFPESIYNAKPLDEAPKTRIRIPLVDDLNGVPAEEDVQPDSIFNYLWPFGSNISTKEKPKKEQVPWIIEKVLGLKKLISDPLWMVLMAVLGIIFFIYFANEFMCQLIGLYYPTYCMYTLLNYSVDDRDRKIISIMKYFIVYNHLEVLTYLLKIIFFPFVYHLKFIAIIMLIYSNEYRGDWSHSIYQNAIFYDKVILQMINSIVEWIRDESTKVKKTE